MFLLNSFLFCWSPPWTQYCVASVKLSWDRLNSFRSTDVWAYAGTTKFLPSTLLTNYRTADWSKFQRCNVIGWRKSRRSKFRRNGVRSYVGATVFRGSEKNNSLYKIVHIKKYLIISRPGILTQLNIWNSRHQLTNEHLKSKGLNFLYKKVQTSAILGQRRF